MGALAYSADGTELISGHFSGHAAPSAVRWWRHEESTSSILRAVPFSRHVLCKESTGLHDSVIDLAPAEVCDGYLATVRKMGVFMLEQSTGDIDTYYHIGPHLDFIQVARVVSSNLIVVSGHTDGHLTCRIIHLSDGTDGHRHQ